MIKLNKKNKTTIGRQAEEMACRFLQHKGLYLLQRNYRCHYGEIDLIMQDQTDIVFVEVRSRHSLEYGYAHESINQKKTKKIIKTATYFLQYHGYLDRIDSRFDVIAIHPIDNKQQIEWIKDAFTASY